jgi:hypothetical protein
MNQDVIVRQTRCWVESVVVDLDLCPFARHVLEHEQLRIAVCMSDDEAGLMQALIDELSRLDSTPATEIDTTLLVHPRVLTDFGRYNEFLWLFDELLHERGYEGVYQLASFHPDYCFEGSDERDPANFTNRSPWPMLHLLREDSLAHAIASYPAIEQVPERNIERLRNMGLGAVQRLLADCRDS